jgi:hypothetical protein
MMMHTDGEAAKAPDHISYPVTDGLNRLGVARRRLYDCSMPEACPPEGQTAGTVIYSKYLLGLLGSQYFFRIRFGMSGELAVSTRCFDATGFFSG